MKEETENENPSIAEETMAMCKILYCQKDLPMTKTCMCWGWECGEGWHQVLKRLSCELEALNLQFYDKYKVRIQADQVKEKFGTLRFYYSVVCDNFNEEGIEANKVIDAFETKKDNGYFGLKHVVDEPGRTVDEIDENGEKRAVWHPPKTHTEITAHKDEYDTMKALADGARKILAERGRYEITPEQRVIMEYMDSEADARVKKAEDDCYNTCETCGSQIGTDWSPRCETTGWIRYICDRCADKLEFAYMKNGEKWQAGKLVATKEQIKKEHEEFEAKMKKRAEEKAKSSESPF
jgi:hypothetical protein